MASQRESVERRQCRRFRVRERTFAVVRSAGSPAMRNIQRMNRAEIAVAVFKTKPAKMGQIIDLSSNGLAFSYFVIDENIEESNRLDILLAEDNFYLEDLHFITVREERLENEAPFNPIIMKLRGVRFVDLTEVQLKRLVDFINTKTRGEV